ncbi:MAG: hypothetical protein RSE14_09630 [Erythrobacter sp.]|uniref:beta strand repeat-containing protein n=1 Tax=Erythrobacter sp. TaxID=1042 RepID=UPI002B473C71|nr:hypothetical protein [Erythrobacter sp.]WRH69545.1 MAG: hypothetical protein RSE14_09630 [Erythrobacter sp.]
MPSITGTTGNDVINGTQADDTINGGGGNDTIVDRWGDDIIDGGDGDDVIIDEAGSNTIRGGAGNDRITISDRYSGLGSVLGNPRRTNVIEGGAGNDFVTIGQIPIGTLSVDLGDGDDVLRIDGRVFADTTYRLGSGRDTVVLTFRYGDGIRASLSALTIADFTAGEGGDILNLGEAVRGVFNNPSAFAAFSGGNPFANGVLRLVQSGADTLVQFDYDGSKGTAIRPFTLVRLQNVTATSLTAANFAGLDPAGGSPLLLAVNGTEGADLIFAPSSGGNITAGGGNDEIIGGFRADIIDGGAGNDIIDGGAGDDTLRGGDGDDTITDEWGNDTIEGGGGNDRIDIYRPPLSDGGLSLPQTVTINAGDGNDAVSFRIGGDRNLNFSDRDITLIAHLGAGDDVITLTAVETNADLPTTTLTMGSGRDRLVLDNRTFLYGLFITITDFAAGNSGDILDLARAIQIGQGWNRVANPFATGHLLLVQSGADTLVRFDFDGAGGGSGEGTVFTLVRLVGVTASSLTAANFNGYNPTGAASSFQIRAGTSGNDVLTGSYDNDVIDGGDGDDVITEVFGGSDTLDGGNGNDIIRVDTGYSPTSDTVTIRAGAGNDLVEVFINTSSGQTYTSDIDLGSGDDRLLLRILPSGGTTLTLGAGRDVIVISEEVASQTLGAFTITDFQTGAGGDLFDWNLFVTAELASSDPSFEPFISEFVRLEQVGNDTHLQLSLGGYSQGYVTFAVFQNTVATSFTAENLGFDPNHATHIGTGSDETLDGTGNLDVIWAGAGNDTVNGLAGDDRLYGQSGDDIINGGDGNDFIRGGEGVDTLRGDGGNDTIDGWRGRDAIFGGDGDDIITDTFGTDAIEGGVGNDTINVSYDFITLITNGEAAGTILAGDGNDTVNITNAWLSQYTLANPGQTTTPFISVNLGAGDDTLVSDGMIDQVTLGSGRDVIRFVEGVDSAGMVVTDFQTGANGDRIDFGGFLYGLSPYDISIALQLRLGADPFALGVLQLRQAGADVQVIFIPSVSGDYVEELVMTFQNTQVANFTSENFSGFNPLATPTLPRYVTADTTIAAGQTVTASNVVPDGLAVFGGNAGYTYRAGGSVSFTNNGTVETITNQPGFGTPIGFAVSRSSGPGADAWFVNSATGRFIVAADNDDGSGVISEAATEAYGFYAPQQALHFRNDGYFEVTSVMGSATGVLTGFDVNATREVINNGTIIADGGYGGFGVVMGFAASFRNTGTIAAYGLIEAVGVRWRQYAGGSFVNTGTIFAINSPDSPFFSVGVLLIEIPTAGNSVSEPRVIDNSGVISADIAILSADGSPPGSVTNHVRNTGQIEGAILLGFGNDSVFNNGGGVIRGVVLLEQGNDLYDGIGGTLNGSVRGGLGDDTYRIDNAATEIIEEAGEGTDTVEINRDYTLRDNFENLRLLGGDALSGTGNALANRIVGNGGGNRLTGGLGDDIIDGGGNVDTAIVRGTRSQYTVTQTSTGVFQVVGPDGTDTLTAIEFLQFDDQILRLRPGTGVTVNFNTADRSVYQTAMNDIRDFDGNALGGNGGWLRIGQADVNGDGDIDQILVNRSIGRFATVGTAPDGLVYFNDHGWAGETRVAGIYIDPLVEAGIVAPGSDQDSQRRFQNDLQIENINRVLGANDYNRDGIQEVYFALTDGTAYLRALMHADGNIRYANYQSQQEVIDYLTANGFGPDTWAGWFPNTSGGVQGLTDETVAVSESNNLGRAVLTGMGGDDAPTPGMIDMASLAFVAPMIAPEFYG